jgi:hypothetical protein
MSIRLVRPNEVNVTESGQAMQLYARGSARFSGSWQVSCALRAPSMIFFPLPPFGLLTFPHLAISTLFFPADLPIVANISAQAKGFPGTTPTAEDRIIVIRIPHFHSFV